MANFSLEGRGVTAKDAENKQVGKGTTLENGEVLLEHIQPGAVTVYDDEYADIKNTVTVESGKTVDCPLDLTAKADVEVPVKVVRVDGKTPLAGVDVGWRNYGRAVPGKNVKTDAEGKGKIANCLPGGDAKNDVCCIVQGKTFNTACKIEKGIAEVVIKTDAPLDAGSIKVSCSIKAADGDFVIVR